MASDVIVHHINNSKLNNKYDYLILLEPTSPMTTHIDIDKCIKKIIDNKLATSLLCITNHSIPNKNYICNINDNKYLNFKNTGKKNLRQVYDNNYFLTGNLYISKIDSFLKDKTFFQKKTIFMKVKLLKSIEIDTNEDLFLIKKILE